MNHVEPALIDACVPPQLDLSEIMEDLGYEESDEGIWTESE